MKVYWRSGGIIPRILDLGTRWMWVVRFTPLPLYLKGNSPKCPFDRRLEGWPTQGGWDGRGTWGD
jgi:hypothetical protein